jgi:hypothetical protein
MVCSAGNSDIGFQRESFLFEAIEPVMTVESLPQHPGSWNCARDAVTAMRTYSGDLVTAISSVFDQLDKLTDELLARELTRLENQQQTERETLRSQIERLTSVATQLADTVAEQRLLAEQTGDKEVKTK